jgi:large subunit ribosomal protein L7/L12
MSVLDICEFVKQMQDKFGVSAAMPVATGGMASAESSATVAAKEEKSAYKVTLQDGGADKIKVIKALRTLRADLNLADAKKAVEQAPTVIAESAPTAEAEKMKKVLEEAGAKVELS